MLKYTNMRDLSTSSLLNTGRRSAEMKLILSARSRSQVDGWMGRALYLPCSCKTLRKRMFMKVYTVIPIFTASDWFRSKQEYWTEEYKSWDKQKAFWNVQLCSLGHRGRTNYKICKNFRLRFNVGIPRTMHNKSLCHIKLEYTMWKLKIFQIFIIKIFALYVET